MIIDDTPFMGAAEKMEKVQRDFLRHTRHVPRTYKSDIGMIWRCQVKNVPEGLDPQNLGADAAIRLGAVEYWQDIAIAHMDVAHAFNSAAYLIRKGNHSDPRLAALSLHVMQAHAISELAYAPLAMCSMAREIAHDPPSLERQKKVWSLLWWGAKPEILQYCTDHGLVEIDPWDRPVQPGERFLWPAAALP